tara:strand:- start:121 stop:837 length:717 start_codon:yes stop_codon:yes gene_type:complete
MKNISFLKSLKTNLIILLFFFVIIVNFDFFKNVFSIIKYEKDERLKKTSFFCEKDSQGFIIYLKKKYNFQSNPELINNTISPLSDWIYFDFKKTTNKKKLILLNYEETQELDTQFINNEFIINTTPPLVKKIKGVKISLKKKLNNDYSIKLNVNEINFKDKNKLITKKLSFKRMTLNKKINLDLDISDKSKLNQYSITISPLDIDFINDVSILVENKISLSDYKIIDKKQNCYFLEKI